MFWHRIRETRQMAGLSSLPGRRNCCGMCRCQHAAADGFTIVEVVIVVVILAIAAMMAVPMMSSAGSLQIWSAANMMAADLEYAKSIAISRGARYSVVFDKVAKGYCVVDSGGTVIEHPTKKGFDYEVDLRSSGLDQVNLVDVDFDSTDKVTFDSLGIPHNGVGGDLNQGVIRLQAGGTTVNITVEPVTGFISVAG